MNMPHYMFYAPGVNDADIGGHGFSKQYPFILDMSKGRDDYIILLVGEAEKAKILEDSKDAERSLLVSGLSVYNARNERPHSDRQGPIADGKAVISDAAPRFRLQTSACGN